MNLEKVLHEVWVNHIHGEGWDFKIERSHLSDGYNLVLTSPSDDGVDSSYHFLSDTAVRSTDDVNTLARIVDQFLRDAASKHHEMFDKPEEVPLFSEAVVGYRKWRLDDWVLSPVNYGSPWRPGVNKAKCTPQHGSYARATGYGSTATRHEHPPHPDCHCGMNAFFEPGEIKFNSNTPGESDVFITGAVVGWGDLQVHPDGWRAEYAQIVALMWAEVDLKAVATLYNVPLVPDIESLQVEASKHGSPLPESLRPAEKAQDDYLLSYTTYTQALKRQYTGLLPVSGGYTTGPHYTQPMWASPNPYSGAYRRKEQEAKKALKRAEKHKYGAAISHGQRLDEMLKNPKTRQLVQAAQKEQINRARKKYTEPPKKYNRKKYWWQ